MWVLFGATENVGQENAELEIDGQKLQGVENAGHTIEGWLMPVHVRCGPMTL